MPDPLEALRLPRERVEPRAEFAQDLLARVRDASRPTPPAASARRASTLDLVWVAPAIDEDTLDEALELVADTAPEFDPFHSGACIANHAPMAAEALCVLGRPDTVLARTERYRKYLERPLPAFDPIDPREWRAALGDYARVTDWVALFDAELAESAWPDVADRWVRRLSPGAAGSGTHGLVRVAHAVRGVGRRDNAIRRHELAESLAFWAARYETLPVRHAPSAGLRPSEALPRVEQLRVEDRTGWLLFTEPLMKLHGLASFRDVVDLVDVSIDPSVFLSDLTRAVAALLVTNVATVPPRALVHALTGGSATRMMLPYLTDETVTDSLRYGWQVAAAFYAAMVVEPGALDAPDLDGDIEDLLDLAVECGDEHGIKVTEACLREYAIDPDPAYLAAAQVTTRRLTEWGLALA